MKKAILFLLFLYSMGSVLAQRKEISLVLDKALFHNGTFRGLQLDFIENNGVWDNLVMGYANFYAENGRYSSLLNSLNKIDHYGSLTSLALNGNNVSLTTRMQINSDPYVPGGIGIFTLQLLQNGDSLTGTFTGTFRDSIPVSGSVKGTRKLSPLKPIAGFVKPQNGEHPRTIFRKSEIDSIRWRAANTPEGQAMVAQLDAALARPFGYTSRTPGWVAAGNAFKFILTNDPYWANETKRIVQNTMNSSAQSTKMISVAPRYLGLAQAYDMCYNYWQATDPKFREKVGNWLEKRMLDIVKGGGEGYNSHPMSNWMCIAYGSLGTMAMALAGDSVRFVYDEPKAPFLGQVPPSENFIPGTGIVPTNLVVDSMTHSWIYVGPFKKNSETDDCLDSLGGSDSLHPSVGTTVTYDTTTQSFKPLASSNLWRDNNFTGGKYYVDVVNAVQHSYFSTAYYYSVLNNQTAGYKKLNLNNFGEVDLVAWVAGKRLKNGDLVYLDQGPYPVLVEATIGVTEPWGKIAFRLTFSNKTTDQAQTEYASNVGIYQSQLADWTARYNEYLAKGKTVYTADLNLRLAEQGMKRWFQLGLGDHGWYTEGEGYLHFALTCGGAQFLHAYAQVMGADFGEGYDSYRILPKLMYENVVGKMWEWGPAGWANFGLQEERSGCLNMLFGNLYAYEKPAFKWMYDKEVGLAGTQSFDIYMPQQAAYALKNYPFKLATVHPSRLYAKHLYDGQKGYFLGRNGWTYTRDLVTTYYLKQEFKMGTHQASDAPEIRIQGFGKQLARILQTSVSQTTNNEQGGKIIQYHADTSGSFILSARMDEVYKGPWATNTYPSLGIKSHRSFANDFSGKSGAPGLYALVDQFKGGTGHTFKMVFTGATTINTSATGFSANLSNNIKLSGKVVLPTNASITANNGNLSISGDSTFFIVMTLTEGTGPAIAVNGTGLSAVVQVGAQSVWYADSILHLQEVNFVPVVKITNPQNSSVFNSSASFQITADATDNDGIKKLEFFGNDTLISVDTTAPYSAPLANLWVGTHVLKAKAWDTKMAWNYSTPLTITIVPNTPPPAVGLLSGNLMANNYVVLNWSDETDLEDNYVLERKMENGEYITFATLPANSTSFLDVNTCSNCSLFYRLRSANANGTSAPSNVVVIQITTGVNEIEGNRNETLAAFPNPFSNKMTLQLNMAQSDFITMDVYNLQGQWLMHQNPGLIGAGKKNLILEMSGLPPGIHVGVVRGKEGKIVGIWKGTKE